ncbi:MAG: phage virion morphogenesis protein, partial [Magnetococcales bacterium]|nr:phage virion morphogenesis protein [Magnetococcales bacterium]
TQDRFDAQKDPQGKPWLPLSNATKERKRIDKILTESSRLRDSISCQAGSDEVRSCNSLTKTCLKQSSII